MTNNKTLFQQMQDFCEENTPDAIRENTRILTLALADSEYFEVLDRAFRSEILTYLHNVEDILLSGFQLKNLSHDRK